MGSSFMRKKIQISLVIILSIIIIFLLVIVKEGAHLSVNKLDETTVQFRAYEMAGIINLESGEVIVEPTYDGIFNCREGVCNTYKNNKAGLIDFKGNVLLKNKYEVLNCPYGNKPYCVAKLDKKTHLVDYEGNIVVDLSKLTAMTNPIPHLDSYTDDFIVFQNYLFDNQQNITTTQIHVMDYDGNLLFDEPINNFKQFEANNEIAILYEPENKTYGFVNIDERKIVAPKYDVFTLLNNNLIIVKEDSKYGVINHLDEVVIDFQYDALFYKEGLFYFKQEDLNGVMNENGEVLNTFIHDPAYFGFYNDLSRVRVEDKWGFINRHGEVMIETQFENAFPFSEGLAAVKKYGKFGFINTNGDVVIDYQYDFVDSFKDGVAYVVSIKDGIVEEGFINQQNEKLTLIHDSSAGIPFEEKYSTYEQRNSPSLYNYYYVDGDIVYYKTRFEYRGFKLDFNEDGQINAVYNQDGDQILDNVIEEIFFYDDNFFCTKSESKICYDATGQVIWELNKYDLVTKSGSVIVQGSYWKYGSEANFYDEDFNLIFHKSKKESILIDDRLEKMLIVDDDQIYLFDLNTSEKEILYHLSFIERLKLKFRAMF
jgi:WG containing repeat